MPIIRMPDNTQVNFPDDMPKEQIKSLIASKFPDTIKPQENNAGSAKEAFGLGLSQAVPFGGKITSALAAAAVSPFVDESYSDLYNQAQNYEKATAEAHPLAYTAGGLTGIGATMPLASTKAIGAIPTGIRGAISEAIPQAIQKTGQFVNTGNIGAKLAKGATVGAGTGALYGAGSSEDMGEGAIQGAGLGAVGGAAVPAIGGIVGKILSQKPTVLSAEAIRRASSGKYQSLADVGEVISPQTTNQFLDEAEKLKPQPIAGKVLTSQDMKYIKEVDEYKDLLDQPLTLEDANRLYKSIGEKVNDYVDKTTGRVDTTGNRLMQLQDKLSDIIENSEGTQQFQDAKKLWQVSRKTEDVERILQRADMMDNSATGIKTGFRTLAMNPSKMRSYNPKEREMITKLAKGEPVMDTLRTVLGSRLLSTIVGSSGGLGGATAGAAISMAARSRAEAVLVKKAMDVLNEIQTPARNILSKPTVTNAVNMPINTTNAAKITNILGGNQ